MHIQWSLSVWLILSRDEIFQEELFPQHKSHNENQCFNSISIVCTKIFHRILNQEKNTPAEPSCIAVETPEKAKNIQDLLIEKYFFFSFSRFDKSLKIFI